ncbi:hypothetical protein [Rhodobacter sp. 24-YEA-8]|uniref:hypothetical protein n=1 Tax=Rhodobacter sp. 24-YEA-8 TaxID=1884310 RepID=UPI00089920F0|nr:hypothetical protein [Rhodobacter sp. 24-YEA-8]SEB67967.1 hypothetical protein SAMN05519105_1073 [Rhodobacter sp. 24-YEA-8]
MIRRTVFTMIATIAALSASAAFAECTGSNGRGWGKGKGNGAFEMSASDKTCLISYPGFIYEQENRRVPATEVKLTRAPKSGKITLSKQGIIYTPTAGFKGKDKFCTKNTAEGEKGTLAGCVTVTVK